MILWRKQGTDSDFGTVVGTDIVHTVACRGSVELVFLDDVVLLVYGRVAHEVTGKQDRVRVRIRKLHQLRIAFAVHQDQWNLEEGILGACGVGKVGHGVGL